MLEQPATDDTSIAGLSPLNWTIDSIDK